MSAARHLHFLIIVGSLVTSLAWLTLPAYGSALKVQPNSESTCLCDGAGFLFDESGHLGIADALTQAERNWGERPGTLLKTRGGAVWLRRTVENTAPAADSWVAHYYGALMPEINFYLLRQDGVVESTQAGSRQSWVDWSGREPGLRFVLAAGERATIYVRMASENPVYPEVRISHVDEHMAFETRRNILFGSYFGTIVSISLVNLIVYLMIRRRIHVVYAAYGLATAANLFVLVGYWDMLARALGAPPALYGTEVMRLSFAGAVITAAAFISSFVNTKELFPRFHSGLKVALYLVGALCLVGYLPVFTEFSNSLIQAAVGVVGIGGLVLAAASYRRGYAPAGTFLIGWAPYIAGVVLWVLAEAGFLPRAFWTMHAVPMGQMIEIIFLGVVLVEDLRSHESVKMQAAESEELRTLIRTLTHDLATPLSVVKGTIQRCLRFDPANAMLQRIQRANQATIDIVDHIRQIRALKDQKLNLDRVPVQLGLIIDECIDLLRERLETKRVQIRKRDDQGAFSTPILVEPQSFKVQVIMNLLTNAIKFSKEGSYIELMACASGDDRLEFLVRDHGVGIPRELVNRLFDPTARTTRTGTSGEKGTGYGMPIVKAFVEAYGGGIQVESVCERDDPVRCGTTIRILVARADPARVTSEGGADLSA